MSRSTVAVFILLGNMVLAVSFTGAATEAERTSLYDCPWTMRIVGAMELVVNTERSAALFRNGLLTGDLLSNHHCTKSGAQFSPLQGTTRFLIWNRETLQTPRTKP